MSGDIMLTSRLVWPASSSSFRRVVNFLIERTNIQASREVLLEARDDLEFLDLEIFPIPYRDELYEILRDQLVPDAKSDNSYYEALGEVAALAQRALDEHRGKSVAYELIRLDAEHSWPTQRTYMYMVTRFLEKRLADPELQEHLRQVGQSQVLEESHLLDLGELRESQRKECLRLIRDGLMDYARDVIPEDSPRRDWELAKLAELVSLAEVSLAVGAANT